MSIDCDGSFSVNRILPDSIAVQNAAVMQWCRGCLIGADGLDRSRDPFLGKRRCRVTIHTVSAPEPTWLTSIARLVRAYAPREVLSASVT